MDENAIAVEAIHCPKTINVLTYWRLFFVNITHCCTRPKRVYEILQVAPKGAASLRDTTTTLLLKI